METLTVDEAARKIGRCRSWVLAAARLGLVVRKKLRPVLIDAADFERFVSELDADVIRQVNDSLKNRKKIASP